MWNRVFAWLLVLALLGSSCAAPHNAEGVPLSEPLRVLLIGDSISNDYTSYVREALGARAHVVRPVRDSEGRPENCKSTTEAVKHLDRWLANEGGDWDVIHFNFGLHDLKRVDPETGQISNSSDHPQYVPPERYETQLRGIVTRLRETKARLVFATTTPIPDIDLVPYRAYEDVLEYNRIATNVMEEEDVAINDLFQFALAQLESIQRPKNIHFTKDGSRILGDRVAEAILEIAGLAAEREKRPGESR